jgi:predicted permease
MNSILILSIVIIGAILSIIGVMIAIKKSSKKNTKTIKKSKENGNKFDFEDLMDIVKNPNTPSDGVLDALIYFNENFKINEENRKKCFVFLSRVLTHPNRSKNIFQYFHKKVKTKNPEFKKQLENMERKAL